MPGGREEFLSHPWVGRLLIAVAGPLANLITAFVVMVSVGLVGVQYPDYASRLGVTPDTSQAFQAGLREGDRVVEVGGRPVKSWIEIFTAERAPAEGSSAAGGRAAGGCAALGHASGGAAGAGALEPAASLRPAGGGRGGDRDAGLQGGHQGGRPHPRGERQARPRLGGAAGGASGPDGRPGAAAVAARRAGLRPDRDAHEFRRGAGGRGPHRHRGPAAQRIRRAAQPASSRWTWVSARPAPWSSTCTPACGSR